MRLYILVFLLVNACALYAQRDFRDGFIILNNKDTLWGKVDYRSDHRNTQVCTFIKKGTDITATYAPGEIAAYRFLNGKYYVSKEVYVNNTYAKVFIEYLANGMASVYYLVDDVGKDHFYISKKDTQLQELPPYSEDVVNVNGTNYLVSSKAHIQFLKDYLKDCPQISSDIENLKRPDPSDLIVLAQKYHDKTCNGEKCIIYSKKVLPLKFMLEPYAGVLNFSGNTKNDFLIRDVLYYQMGANISLALPSISEKIYLKIGIATFRIQNIHLYGIDISYTPETIFKIPFQFQYIYPKGNFGPKLSYGVSYYSSFSGKNIITPVSLNGGFNYKIYKGINLSSFIETEFNSKVFFIPTGGLFSYSFNAGLCFNL